MSIAEILNIIHKERVELEIFEELQRWLIEDRNRWIDSAMEDKAIIRAVRDIATKTKSSKGAIEAIINLCSEEN